MNHCPSSTNKLVLKQIVYPNADKPTWFIPQADIDTTIAKGTVPEVVIEGAEKAAAAPKIAVLLTRDKHPDRAKADYSMPISMVEAITLSGGYPCFMVFEKIEEQLAMIQPDGVLLPGGDFALPSAWLEQAAAHKEETLRAKAYLACLEYAQNKKIPLLGICAGMQMLAGFCGAKITLAAGHRGIIKTFAHEISILPNSLLAKITSMSSALVNSNHSEAVSGNHHEGCRVSAVASDGVVEAIEPLKPWSDYVLGIQSHPEYFVKTQDEFAVKVFKSFIEACRV